MSLPVWDPIDIPPSVTLIDANGLVPEELKQQVQAEGLQIWLDQNRGQMVIREWQEGEGIFAVYDDGILVGVTLILDVKDA